MVVTNKHILAQRQHNPNFSISSNNPKFNNSRNRHSRSINGTGRGTFGGGRNLIPGRRNRDSSAQLTQEQEEREQARLRREKKREEMRLKEKEEKALAREREKIEERTRRAQSNEEKHKVIPGFRGFGGDYGFKERPKKKGKDKERPARPKSAVNYREIMQRSASHHSLKAAHHQQRWN